MMNKKRPLTEREIVQEKRYELFLDILAKTGNISRSAKMAGFPDARWINSFRKSNKTFDEKVKEAVLAGVEALEGEAYRRAVLGVKKPVIFKGEHMTDENGEKMYVREYSDGLLQTLLKANNPNKFMERQKVENEVNVNIGIALLPTTISDQGSWEQEAQKLVAQKESLDRANVIDVEAEVVEETKTPMKLER
jgi:hypothetical protein